LEKFFSHAFGNIFEAGILHDPELDLPADAPRSAPQSFQVCGEDSITVVLGWDKAEADLFLELHTPGGAVLTAGSAGIEDSSGRTWTFLRVPLPHGSERDGTWQAVAVRPGGGGEFPPPSPALRFFVNVIPSGGVRLLRVQDAKRYYTGDSINPMVYLRYGDGGWPANAEVTLTVSVPDTSIGNVLTREKLHAAATVDGDTIPAPQATLAALEAASGKPVVGYTEQTFKLEDDSASTEGKFESGGVLGLPIDGGGQLHLPREGDVRAGPMHGAARARLVGPRRHRHRPRPDRHDHDGYQSRCRDDRPRPARPLWKQRRPRERR